MDKKIERIKKEIKHQNRLYLATALVGLAAIAVDLSGFPASAYTNPDAASFVQGFLIGLFAEAGKPDKSTAIAASPTNAVARYSLF